MGKYEEPHDGTVELIVKALDKSFLSTTDIKIKILVDNKLTKKPVKAVKANDLLQHETGNHIYIFVNEVILDELFNVDNEFPEVIIDEALASIKFDIEKGSASIEAEDIKTYRGVLSKYGFEKYDVVDESIKTLYQVEKDKSKK